MKRLAGCVALAAAVAFCLPQDLGAQTPDAGTVLAWTNGMSEAKGVVAAEKAVASFKSGVRAYLKTRVSGPGGRALAEREVAGEKSRTARACVEAMTAVLARTKDEKARSVYERQLAQMSRQAEKLEARYRELRPAKPAEATTRASPRSAR